MIKNYYKRTQCSFIQCHLDFNAKDILLKEIQKSGLTYIIFHLEDSCCYCVVNNRFAPEDFRKLMVDWCGRLDQEQILVTWPHRDTSSTVEGFFCNSYGPGQEVFNTQQVEQKICELAEKSHNVELHETTWPNNYSVAGRVIGIHTFKRLYPHLCI